MTDKAKTYFGISAKQMGVIAGAETKTAVLTEYRDWAVLRADKLKTKSISRARKWEKLVEQINARLSGTAVPVAAHTFTRGPKKSAGKKTSGKKGDVSALLAGLGMSPEEALIALSKHVGK